MILFTPVPAVATPETALAAIVTAIVMSQSVRVTFTRDSCLGVDDQIYAKVFSIPVAENR